LWLSSSEWVLRGERMLRKMIRCAAPGWASRIAQNPRPRVRLEF
jgi:hypothetical protein